MPSVSGCASLLAVSAALAAACGQSSPSSLESAGGATIAGGPSSAGSSSGGSGSSGTPSTGGQASAAGGGGSAALSDGGAGSGTRAGAGGASDAAGAANAGASGTPPATVDLNSGAGPWGTGVTGGPAHAGTVTTGTVSIDRTNVVGNVGAGFAGFSVEKSHLTNSSLTGKNAPLIALLKLLGPTTLRIGANDVDLSTWVPATKPGAGGPPFGHSIGTAMVDDLADFVQATRAQLIYAVNFHDNDAASTVAEVTYANQKLGTSIVGFEVGNELDKYATWAAQKSQWEAFGTAITAVAPSVRLIGPASTSKSSLTFTTPFAADEAAKFGDKLSLLTQHFYVAGATSSGATTSALQTFKSDIPSTMKDAAGKNEIAGGWRMGECNTFSGHGKQGISDTLIAALWSIDFMFQVALNGGSGVNFHGAETGMDGENPFYYEPILEKNGAVSAAMPLYYGMLFFYLAGRGPVLATSVTSSNPNFSAYALDYRGDGSTSVVLINRNASTGVDAAIQLGSTATSASAIYLQGSPAGSLTAAAGSVTLAGAAVTPSGAWSRNPPFNQAISSDTVSVFVPPASAALVRVQ